MVISGVQDMEDGTIVPETGVMPSVAEQDAEDYPHSRNSSIELNDDSRSPRTPLLQNNSPNNTDRPAQQDSTLADNSSGRASSTSMSESDDTDHRATPDPRGEAPPYAEVSSLHQQQQAHHSIVTPAQTVRALAIQSQSNPATPVGSTAMRERRRSGLRVLLDVFSNSRPTSRAPAPNPAVRAAGASSSSGHTRNPTSQSTAASTLHHSERSQSPRAFHRPSHSGGSNLSISGFRPPSSQRSNNNVYGHRVNSPSQISLQSISAPLTHTVVRTDFTYPKSGPTPEQLKFISSLESLGKFGVPYGPDAIAYAESTSRRVLDPPPDFDAPGSNTSSQFHAERRMMSVTSPLSSEVIVEGDSAATSPLSSSVRLELERPPPESLAVAPGPGSSLRPPGQVLSTSNVGGLPPTSFRPPTASSFYRSESRASSFLSTATYRTALETMSGGSHTDAEAEADGESELPTPMVSSHHVLEGTNTTITAATASA
jgi:hypothetical protein